MTLRVKFGLLHPRLSLSLCLFSLFLSLSVQFTMPIGTAESNRPLLFCFYELNFLLGLRQNRPQDLLPQHSINLFFTFFFREKKKKRVGDNNPQENVYLLVAHVSVPP